MEDSVHSFSSEAPYNTGILTMGAPAAPPEETTVVVAGPPRGGTTMAAWCLSTLGLPMGMPPFPPRHNFEDPAFAELLHFEEPRQIDLPRLRDLIQQRNQAHRIWGFKLPLALNSLGVLERELRNPRFLLMFRDVVAVASREVMAIGLEATQAMLRGLAWQRRMIEFSASRSAPCMLVSYEKALQFPANFVDVTAHWCGLTISAEQREQACQVIQANNPVYVAREDPTVKAAK